MKQRIRAFVAIDEGGRYAVSGGTATDDAQHIENVRSALQWPPGGGEYKGQVAVFAIEADLPTPKHSFIAEVAGLIEDKAGGS